MNETNATVTATAAAAAAAEIRNPKAESRIQPGPGADPVEEATPCSSRITLHAPRSRRFTITLLAAAVTTAAAWSGYRWLDHIRAWVRTDNAYVAAHVHQVSSRLAGTVSEVLVEENEAVAAGRIKVHLEEDA